MITREELLKQETRHDEKIKEIEENIDEALKEIRPDEIKDNAVMITIYGEYTDNILQEVFNKYENKGGYKKITFEIKEDCFIDEKGFRYDIKLFI